MSDHMVQGYGTSNNSETICINKKSVIESGNSSKSLWKGYKLQPITISSTTVLQHCVSCNDNKGTQNGQLLPGSVHVQFSPMPKEPRPHVKTLQAADLSKFPKSPQYLSVTSESTHLNFPGKWELVGKSSPFSENKENGLFRMFNPSPVSSCSYESGLDQQSRHNLLFDSKKQDDWKALCDIYFKTASIKSNFLQPTSLSAGITSSKPSKEKESSIEVSVSPMNRPISRNHENKLINMAMDQSLSLDKTLSLEKGESSWSTTKTPNVEDLYHAEEVEHLNSKHPLHADIGPEPSSRWVKRLRMQSMDSYAVGTKSLKLDEASDGRRVHKLLTRVLNYSRSNSDITFHKRLEQHQNGKFTLSSNSEDSCVELLKKSHSWIRRWCCRNQEVGHPPKRSEAQLHSRKDKDHVHVSHAPRKEKVIQEDSEPKQFPSIAAMALMGKAVSNFRPCEFRRKGPSIVWIT